MGNEQQPRQGMWARFWGPNNGSDTPDVEGPIEAVNPDNSLLVNDRGVRVRVTRGMSWARTVFTAAAVVTLAYVLWPDSDYA